MSREIKTDQSEKEADDFQRMAEWEGKAPEELFADMVREGLDAIRIKAEDAQIIHFPVPERLKESPP